MKHILHNNYPTTKTALHVHLQKRIKKRKVLCGVYELWNVHIGQRIILEEATTISRAKFANISVPWGCFSPITSNTSLLSFWWYINRLAQLRAPKTQCIFVPRDRYISSWSRQTMDSPTDPHTSWTCPKFWLLLYYVCVRISLSCSVCVSAICV